MLHKALHKLTLTSLVVCAAVLSTPASAADPAPKASLMNAPRPLFFNDIAALDKVAHRSLSLPAQRHNFAFAAQANLLPLTFAEVSQALHSYPVVLVAEGTTVALVGMTDLKPGGNRFVDANGQWRVGAYIPAYVRGYPFISVQVSEQAEPVLALDPQAADFKAPGGQPLLLADGAPSEQLKGIMAFQGEYRQLAQRTHTMVQALKDAGVLEEGSLQLQATAGGEPQKIGGFLVVSEAKLKALSADALKKLMDADALGLAYAQMFSMGSLGNLFAQPASAPQTTAQDAKAVQPVVKKSKKKAE